MFGYTPDHHALRSVYVKWAHRFGLLATPAPRDLRDAAPYVLDQGSCSGCVGHGTATGIATSCAVAGAPLLWVPSPGKIYGNAVALERGDPLAHPLRDEGSMPALAMRGLTEFGIAPLEPAGAATDCFPTNGVLPEPDLGSLETEGEHRYVGWYEIGNADEARQAIASGAPVGLGTYVDSAFMRWTPGRAPLGLMNEDDPDGGGHWTVLLASEAGGRFWLRNSWGAGWGANGDCLVTDACVNQASQLIAFGYRKIGR
jgi:hypothetical protein